MENGRQVKDAKGRPVRVPNPRYTASLSMVTELVRRSKELVKLLQGSPGSLDEVAKQEHRNALLSRLEKMAKALTPQPAFEAKPPPEVEENPEPPVREVRGGPFPTIVTGAIVAGSKIDLTH